MNFNDINRRIARIYKSIDKKFISDIEKHTKITHDVKDNIHEVGFHFDEFDKDEASEILLNIISSLGKLKDHIKNKLKSQNKDPQLFENLINNSINLSILIDLWNQDKHGYPLTRKKRSNKNPKIVNIRSGLTFVGGNQGTVTFTVTPKGSSFKHSTDNMILTINADIIDEKGVIISTVEDLIIKSLSEIENFLKDNNII